MPDFSHPLEGLMKTTMESIRDMVNVNTILGEPVETADGTVIIPISRVSFGFAAGGSEYEPERDVKEKTSSRGQSNGGGNGNGNNGAANGKSTSSAKSAASNADADAQSNADRLPFGGGSGAGISLQPVAFLVVGNGGIRLLPVDGGALWNRIIDMAPGVIEQFKASLAKQHPDNLQEPEVASEASLDEKMVIF